MAELSAELFESTLRGLRGDSVHNRKHPRAPMRMKMKLFPVERHGVGKPREVWTRDLSTGGIGLLSAETMRAGSTFIVRLPREDHQFLCLLCTVQNCVAQAGGVHVVGASFVEITQSAKATADDEVQRISQAVLG